MLFQVEHLLTARQIAGVYTGFKKKKLDKRDRVAAEGSRVKRAIDDEDERDAVNDLFDIEGDPELEFKTEPLFDYTDLIHMDIMQSDEYDQIFEGVEEKPYRGWLGLKGC